MWLPFYGSGTPSGRQVPERQSARGVRRTMAQERSGLIEALDTEQREQLKAYMGILGKFLPFFDNMCPAQQAEYNRIEWGSPRNSRRATKNIERTRAAGAGIGDNHRKTGIRYPHRRTF